MPITATCPQPQVVQDMGQDFAFLGSHPHPRSCQQQGVVPRAAAQEQRPRLRCTMRAQPAFVPWQGNGASGGASTVSVAVAFMWQLAYISG